LEFPVRTNDVAKGEVAFGLALDLGVKECDGDEGEGN
jgi:hypothetical protein